MKRNLLILAWTVFGVIFFSSLSVAQCPEDTVDRGECDTLYVEIYPGDQEFYPPGPHFARFPIYVTHDVPDPYIDSIQGFVISLCYTHSNSSKYCSLSGYWNNINLYPQADLDRSIFRHFVEGQDTLIHNWMMDLSQKQNGEDWDTKILDLGDEVSHFWLTMVPTGMGDQRFWGGSRVLLVTMTFWMEDTMTVCVDTCFWPPSDRLAFARSDAVPYVPRHLMPICEYVGWQWPPPVWFSGCPVDETHNTNGMFASTEFEVVASDGIIVSVASDFVGEGVDNVELSNVFGLYTPQVTGNVVYEVTDHCQEGGTITITAWDDLGQTGDCDFDVILFNHPPVLNLPDTWFALADYTMGLQVSADDPDYDPVATIVLNALWYEEDSLQAPTNSPSYDGGNPGLFTWVPAEADTGTWIGSFSATDVCDAVDTHRVTILVGTLFCGDCFEDAVIDLGDLVYLVSYLYKAGHPPEPVCKADTDCDGVVDIGDVLYLINYLYRFGPAPCFECCAGLPPRTFSKPDSPN